MVRKATLAAVAAALGAVLLAVPATAASRARQETYFRAADEGISRTKAAWWNPVANWFSQAPHEPGDGPRDVATPWDVFPLFEAADLVATAPPSAPRRAMVRADRARRGALLESGVQAGRGYWYRPARRPNVNVFFDDNGWWALAFFDA
jgi:hypothetical protein